MQRENGKTNVDVLKSNDNALMHQRKRHDPRQSKNTSPPAIRPSSLDSPPKQIRNCPQGAPSPTRPWTDFIHEQRLTFGILNDTFPIDSRVFENRAFLAGLGDRVSQRRIADEKSLEYFLHNSVEDPVRVIIQQLREVETVTAAFEIGDGIVFENHPHALGDTAEEVVERETPATPRTPDHGRDLNQLRPDQICVTRSNNDPFAPSTMVYISEYKSPCKLTVKHLRIGLRPMDIYKEVVNRKTIPTSVDPDALFRYHAERLTASAITQKCLLGLVRGGFLDPKCPNVALHCSNRPTQACHPISHGKWLALLQRQLERSLDEGITRLRQGGTRSVLFQVTLLAYGYTFLGKGTVRTFVSDLTHEATVYNRLSPLQGRDVPVFLGAIDLRAMDKIYYFVHRVYVVHIMFLSWGGDSLADALKTGGFTDKNLQSMAITALRAMHQEGVVHKDVLFSNMLFNREVKRVMMIDFERAVLVKPPRLPLAQLVPNKRRRKPEETERKKTATSSCNIRRVGDGFSKDILDAKMVFWDLDSRYGIAK
ncbi:hypothetical protein LB504_013126 [Fusarium proliferatum]|nr:hypothetical protein LB504_013126 [Fusarium proliferatum]